MRVFAVDPGVHTGFVKIFLTEKGARIEKTSEILDPSPIEVRQMLVDSLSFSKLILEEENILVLEDQHKGIMGIRSLISLVRRAEKWAVIAEELGIRVVRIHPTTWQNHYGPPKHLKSKERKAWFRSLACDMLASKAVGPNECDAFLMGLYFCKTGGKSVEEKGRKASRRKTKNRSTARTRHGGVRKRARLGSKKVLR